MADGPMFMQFLFFFQTYVLTVGVLDYVTVEFATNIFDTFRYNQNLKMLAMFR